MGFDVTGAARVPPYSEGAEQALLGSLLLDAERVMPLCIEAGVSPDTFYIPAHRKIYAMCLWLHERERPIHILSVMQPLKDKGRTEEIGGEHYLETLIDATPTALHAGSYIGEVVKKERVRAALRSIQQAETALYDGNEPDVVLPDHIQSLVDLADTSSKTTKSEGWGRMKAVAHTIRNGGMAGLPTPWEIFNDSVGGAPFGEPTVLAGREGTRKSYLVNQWALWPAKEHGMPGAYFSMEDGVDKTIARSACYLADLNPWEIFVRGRFTEEEMDRVDRAAQEVIKLPVEIIGERGYNIDSIAAEVARGVARHGWKYVFIDAFKDIYGKGGDAGMMDVYKVNRIADMARRHDIALVVVHHINKSLEDDSGYSEGREDGGQWISYRSITGRAEITKGARMVLMLQCRAFRDENGALKLDNFSLDCQKYNFGPTGAVSLVLDDGTGRFREHPDARMKYQKTKIQFALKDKR